jgi:hypothetical protein
MPKPKHSNEEIALFASFSWCLTDFLQGIGEDDSPQVRRRMWSRLKRLQIDTSHWDRSPRRWYTDEALAAAVASSVSVAGALRLLGVPVTGGQHAHLARRIRRAGIDTSHFTGQAHNRGKPSPGRRDPLSVLVVLPAGSDRPKTHHLRAALEHSGVPHLCALCGCGPEWRGQALTLMVDHIDGDWLNNLLENLRYLCPNCHSQTSTWCRQRSARSAA